MTKRIVPTKAWSDQLLARALSAQKNAYCPYSHFPVGAAVLTAAGKIFAGSNVENASFGGTICAERSAIVSAVSAGHTDFIAMAVVTDTTPPSFPCGICLQMMSEFCSPSMKVILASSQDLQAVKTAALKELLPNSFTLAK